MRIISDLHLGTVEKYCTSHFLVFPLCNAKKKTHWEMPGLLKMFLLQKKDYPKRPQIFHRREFLVKQINTEYSRDISQLRLEND